MAKRAGVAGRRVRRVAQAEQGHQSHQHRSDRRSRRHAPHGTPRLLWWACNHHHYTYANLCRDGRVGVALLAPPNIAVRVRGRARLVKERMDTGELLAILEIGSEEAKNDLMRWSSIESAFGFVPPADLEDYYVGAIAKLEDM